MRLTPRAMRLAESATTRVARRAAELSRDYLGGRAVPVSVRWVDNQASRWGSATPAHGTIRISRAVAAMPAYVRDYVLLHELAHLIEPGHTPRFWGLLGRYERLERARGYLAGYAAARGIGRLRVASVRCGAQPGPFGKAGRVGGQHPDPQVGGAVPGQRLGQHGPGERRRGRRPVGVCGDPEQLGAARTGAEE